MYHLLGRNLFVLSQLINIIDAIRKHEYNLKEDVALYKAFLKSNLCQYA